MIVLYNFIVVMVVGLIFAYLSLGKGHIHFHDWSKWQDHLVKNYTDSTTVQVSRCSKCNKLRSREVGYIGQELR